jgi:hypothetical protein
VLSSGQAIVRERERDKQRLDRNLEIAEWIVTNCQGNANVSDVARKVTNQFKGNHDGHRRAINGGRYPVKRDGGRWSLKVG